MAILLVNVRAEFGILLAPLYHISPTQCLGLSLGDREESGRIRTLNCFGESGFICKYNLTPLRIWGRSYQNPVRVGRCH